MTLEMLAIVAFAIIMVELGYFIGRRTGFSDGVLQIDQRGEERDLYRVVIEIPMDELPKRKRLRLKVDTDVDLINSQK